MGRPSNTRELVRFYAEQFARDGIEPTPSNIRQKLQKGSPNTIVEELRAWKADVGYGGLATTPSAGPNKGDMQLQLLQRIVDMHQLLEVLVQQSSEQPIENVYAQLTQLGEGLKTAGSGTTALDSAIRTIESRFEGVNKYMLMQVDEARRLATQWKDRYQTLKEESGQMQTVMRQKMDALLVENAWLKGKLGVAANVGGPVASSPSPSVPRINQPIRQPVYPGFPRAQYSESDDERSE